MIESKLMEELRAVLNSTDEFKQKYWRGEALKRNKVVEDLRDYDADLIAALLKNELIAKSYTMAVDGNTVVKLGQLADALQYKEYWEDSYTKFANKIGLSADGKFIDESADVVLQFPFSDTVLKAGMTKEDAEVDDLRPEEPFLNEVIAKSEIDTLFADKIFNNVERFGTENTLALDNLVIRGNNLLALKSLRAKYEKKVKLVYVDIPYNTGSDSFRYNDRFNRSTWLTFIKNRAEAAFDLVSDDGVMLFHVSFHQFAYLKTMLDSVFGEDRHVLDFNVLVRHPERSLTSDKEFNDVVEYTLVYAKSPQFKMPKLEIAKTADDYVYDVELGSPDSKLDLGGKIVEVFRPESYQVIKGDGHESGLKTTSIRGSIREKNSSGRFYVANLENLKNEYPEGTIFKVPDMGDDAIPYRLFELPKNGNKNGLYYQGMPQSSTVTLKPYPNFLDFVKQFNVVNGEGVYEFRNGKKPEALLQFFVDLFTNANDVVLDYFMGSGTTQAVAMKMGRRFIGIEQMDYIKTVSVERLKKVIEGEQGGISKDVNWQGGGAFVYAELMEKNQGFIGDIAKASTTAELDAVYNRMKDVADFDFRADLDKFIEQKSELAFEDRKQMLVKILDKNQLYYNYADIDDVDVRDLLSDEDYAFNKAFYEDGEV